MKYLFVCLPAAVLMMAAPASAQIVGSLGNFDCVNDTGETAEGFEIEIDDISPADVPDTFPTRFYAQPWVNRFGPPTITAYDNTASGGTRGTRIVWAATWDGSKFVAKYGDFLAPGGGPSGNGVVYKANFTAAIGDQCWLLGQGTGYATSGCEHFGLTITKPYSKMSYHWLVPSKSVPGTLVQSVWKGGTSPIAPQPVYAYVPPVAVGQPPVVHAVAQAPEDPNLADPQFGPARWVKTYTSFAKVPANLDALQANLVPRKGKPGVPVKITWDVLQRAPAGVNAEKEAIDDDPVDGAKGFVAVVKRYEYYDYTGVYDPETHEVICAPELPTGNGPCTRGPINYTYVDPVSGVSRTVREKGKFLGAHNDAVNLH